MRLKMIRFATIGAGAVFAVAAFSNGSILFGIVGVIIAIGGALENLTPRDDTDNS
ncbi:hypothetical protein [Nocardia sp. CA-120079]|uniref:hypothetical protein n=1 Tax=Nocardia sp. CA-120079 TaxID=3239974 RepID=UPI003D967477